jgi:hypothetical protein
MKVSLLLANFKRKLHGLHLATHMEASIANEGHKKLTNKMIHHNKPKKKLKI